MDGPNYPHIKPGSNDPQWQNAVLYSIAGWMSSWYGEEQKLELATAFGGYLKRLNDGSFIGELVDTFGKAKIEGTLTETMLVFEKVYTYREYDGVTRLPIRYSFEKNGQIWKGNFVFHKDEDREICNLSECAISPAINDAFGIVVGPIGR